MADKEQKSNQAMAEIIFPVPLSFLQINENIAVNTNSDFIKSKKKMIEQAFKFHSLGKISDAAKYYQYCINQGCEDYRVFTNYGSVLKDLGKLQEAELSLRKAIKLNPNVAMAHTNLGSILIDLGKLQEAELSLRKAIKLNPNVAMAHSNLGSILIDLGKLQEAELSLRKAIKLNPNVAMLHSNLGSLLIDLGKLQEAELSTRKAIEINPNLAVSHLNLGSILSYLGKLQEAELSVRQAIDLNNDFTDAYSLLRKILLLLGKSKELKFLAKSTIESISFNKGDKLIALLQITITNLLERDFSELFFNLKKINKLISKEVISTIYDKKDKNHTLTFLKFLSLLYPLLEKENIKPNLEKIPHIGESHCLSFAHQCLSISSQQKIIQPVLITGAKAWHFAANENNQWKDSLTQQINFHTYSQYIFISFGEIDCRKEEGILTYSANSGKDILEVCKRTIEGYLNYMEIRLCSNYKKKYYFGIPAPVMIKGNSLDNLDFKRIELIRQFNSLLRKEVLSRGSYFLDVYELTSNKDGVNNNIHMCDDTHLSPKCLSILFKNHLYNPSS